MSTENDIPEEELDEDIPEGYEPEGHKAEGEDSEAESRVKVDAEEREELEGAKTDEEREAIRERRRQERRERKRRKDERYEAIQAENRMLADRLQQLEQSQTSLYNTQFGQAISNLDSELTKAEQAQKYWMQIQAAALNKNDGNAAVYAAQQLTLAQQRSQQLTLVKNQAIAAQQQQQQQPLQDVELARRATAFKAKHSWYRGPNATDSDSAILNALDAALSREGWNPKTDAYWQELEKRAANYLPHRIEKNYNGSTGSPDRGSARGRQPVAGSSGGAGTSSGSGKSGGYSISPERVQAIKDAGKWDDPKERDAMIKRYREYDKANTVRA